MNIKPNLSNLDRLARLIIGIACIYVSFIDTSIIFNNLISILVGIFGVVNIISAAISNCPVYNVIGLSTFPEKSTPDDK